ASAATNSALRTAPARARADIAYSLSPKTAVAVISPTGMRANENHIACVEVSFTVCTVAGCRHYQRECGACGENYYLSGARTKHHLGSVPWRCSRLCRIRASRQAVIIGVPSPADRRILTQRLRLGENIDVVCNHRARKDFHHDVDSHHWFATPCCPRLGRAITGKLGRARRALPPQHLEVGNLQPRRSWR